MPQSIFSERLVQNQFIGFMTNKAPSGYNMNVMEKKAQPWAYFSLAFLVSPFSSLYTWDQADVKIMSGFRNFKLLMTVNK